MPKYIANGYLLHKGKLVKTGGEVELTEEQAKRLGDKVTFVAEEVKEEQKDEQKEEVKEEPEVQDEPLSKKEAKSKKATTDKKESK